jgi:hypothetical protein
MMHLRIFLASPGDVADERTLARRVLEQLPYDPLLRGMITIETVAWDQPGAGTPLSATLNPQTAIAQGLPKPSDCDIVIVMLWSRIGTPLPEEYVKSDGSRYLSGTEWEYHDALRQAEQTGKPDVLVYRRMEEPIFRPSDPEFMERYEQWKRIEKFFASFQNPDGSIQRGYNTYTTPNDFAQHLDLHLRALIRRRIDTATEIKATEPTRPSRKYREPERWHGSPFPGLRPFMPGDSAIFFGRDRETEELLRRVGDSSVRFTAVVGASGVGKTSLTGAGLVARLKKNAIDSSENWGFVRFTPGEVGKNPFLALSAALTPLLEAFPDGHSREVAAQLETDPTTSGFIGPILARLPPGAELFLFIDQFEELFTLCDPAYLVPFVDWLSSAAHTESIRTVVTMRADFYTYCVESPKLAELFNVGTYVLGPPGLAALFEMVTRPAALAGLEMEESLPVRIVEDVSSEPGTLPLLAYTLAELYRVSTNSGVLTLGAYHQLGGVQGSISQRAEDIFLSLAPEEQARLNDIFRELIQIDDQGIATRRRAFLSSVTSDPGASKLVTALTEARLLVIGQSTGDAPQVELAHEGLIRHWPRIVGWIDSMRDDLTMLGELRRAASEWDRRGRRQAYLWSRERVMQVRAMIQRIHPALTESESLFVREDIQATSLFSLRVFLCHAREDKEVVRGLYHRLVEDGFTPWIDAENLLPGQDWEREIRKAVWESEVVLVCLSKRSISKKGFVHKEIKYALDVADQQPEGSIFLIPVRLEETNVPERLSHLHWVNYFDTDGYMQLTKALKHRAYSNSED